MTLDLLRTAYAIENSDDLHISRILLMLNIASRWKTKKHIAGFSKLAILDFLLRNPACLKRVLEYDKGSINVKPEVFNTAEVDSIESEMVAYNFTPWAAKYRKWISILYSKDLVNMAVSKKTVNISITEYGKSIASILEIDKQNLVVIDRCELLIKNYGGMSSLRLQTHLFQVMPELSRMQKLQGAIR